MSISMTKCWWCTLLLLTALTRLQPVNSAAVQLQPVTRLAGWQAHGSWVLNDPRTIAAGTAANRNDVQILQNSNGEWLLADVLTPPEPDLVDFVPGSVQLSTDGRLLAVAARHKGGLASTASKQQELTAGYVFKVVAQPHTPQAFRFQLAARLTLPYTAQRAAVYSSNNTKSSSSSSASLRGLPVSAHVDMSDDGQTFMACWVHASGSATNTDAVSAGLSHAAHRQAAGSSGGAAVFTWRSFGQSLSAVQLPLPQGSGSFGQSCQLSSDGRIALVLGGTRGAFVYSKQAHTPHGSTAAYRAAGWLAGAPASQAYKVTAAALSQSGQQAVLLVQGIQTAGATAGIPTAAAAAGYAALKVFAADGFGHWGDVCNIRLSAHPSELNNTGAVKVTAFPGGVHVWVTLGGSQLMYAVGLQDAAAAAAAAAAAQCPSQPVARTVTREADVGDARTQSPGSALHRQTPSRVVVGTGIGVGARQQAVRSGMLRVDGPQAVYVALE